MERVWGAHAARVLFPAARRKTSAIFTTANGICLTLSALGPNTRLRGAQTLDKKLSDAARKIVLDCILYWNERRYDLYAACVMPDHVHILIEPRVRREASNATEFYSLTEILHTLKSFTAHKINELEEKSGPVWERESFDRLIRSESDLQEKFNYITRNPWDAGVTRPGEDYPWVWFPGKETSRPAAEMGTPAACAPRTRGHSERSYSIHRLVAVFSCVGIAWPLPGDLRRPKDGQTSARTFR